MNFWKLIDDFLSQTGIAAFFADGGWKNLIMILIGCFFLFLAIKKKFEPYLLIPIAFGMILTNIPGAGVFIKTPILDAEQNIVDYNYSGLLGVLYYGVKFEIYPCLIFLGIGAFIVAAISGLLGGKLMCLLTKGKVNPMIGAAGVSAVPMAARVVQKEGQKEDPSNFLLMHAMGPNVAGVIGSAIAAGILLSIFL